MANIYKVLKSLFSAISMAYKASPVFTILAFIVEVPIVLIGFLLLYLSREIINHIEIGIRLNYSLPQAVNSFLPYFALTLISTISIMFLLYFKGIVNERQKLNFGSHIDKTILEQSVKLGIDRFDNAQFYDTIATVNSNKTRINALIYRVIFFTSNFLSLVIAISIAIQSSSLIYPVLIIILCIPALFTKSIYYTKLYDYEVAERRIQRQMSYLAGITTQKSAAKEVRFYRMADFVVPKYISLNTRYLNGFRALIYKHGMVDSFFNILPIFGVMYCLYHIVISISAGYSNIGDFMFMLGIFSAVQNSFLSLVEDAAKAQEGDLALQAYNAYMTEQPTILDSGDEILKDANIITFENVSFIYPLSKTTVFDNASFTINLKQKNALVGMNGSGKSTFIKLILRFYDTNYGRILINGKDIKSYTLGSLRDTFSVMFQNFITYSFSIRDNVSFSSYKNRNDDEEIWKAIKMTGLYETLKNHSLDDSISKDFDDDGLELSGGQKQKLAMARCVFSKAPILIMDEPDASLDAKSEREIIDILNNSFNDKGLIFISHRLSNINKMDKIYVFGEATVIEEGTHEELMMQKGKYYDLFILQAEKYTV